MAVVGLAVGMAVVGMAVTGDGGMAVTGAVGTAAAGTGGGHGGGCAPRERLRRRAWRLTRLQLRGDYRHACHGVAPWGQSTGRQTAPRVAERESRGGRAGAWRGTRLHRCHAYGCLPSSADNTRGRTAARVARIVACVCRVGELTSCGGLHRFESPQSGARGRSVALAHACAGSRRTGIEADGGSRGRDSGEALGRRRVGHLPTRHGGEVDRDMDR
eukprot:2682662-Prymnesium_polylepis.2